MSLTKVTSNVIADGTIAAADLASNSVTTAKIADANVTSAKLDATANKQLAKAWVNFDASRNASGGTDSANTARYIRSSFNVASVTKTGTGIYLIAFTTPSPMADANYCAIGNGSGGNPVSMSATGATTASFSALSYYGGAFIDTPWNTVVVFGN
jgi:hypothetical protein